MPLATHWGHSASTVFVSLPTSSRVTLCDMSCSHLLLWRDIALDFLLWPSFSSVALSSQWPQPQVIVHNHSWRHFLQIQLRTPGSFLKILCIFFYLPIHNTVISHFLLSINHSFFFFHSLLWLHNLFHLHVFQPTCLSASLPSMSPISWTTSHTTSSMPNSTCPELTNFLPVESTMSIRKHTKLSSKIFFWF